MSPEQPMAIVLAGINGAGKTTASQKLLADRLGVMCFVNADMIARGLNAIVPESVAMEAGQVMWNRLRELRTERADFAFETTLAGRTYLPFLRELRQDGYGVEFITSGFGRPNWRRHESKRASGPAGTTYRNRRSSAGTAEAWRTFGPRTGRKPTRGSCTTTAVSRRCCSRRATVGTTRWCPKLRPGNTSERRWAMRKDVSIEDRTKAIQEGVRDALREHALLGRSVSIWRDGRIVWLTPAEILEELRHSEAQNGSANGAAQDHHD